MLPSKYHFSTTQAIRHCSKFTIHYTQIGRLTVYPCMLPKQFHNVLYIFLEVDFCQYDSEQYDLVQYLYKIHYGFYRLYTSTWTRDIYVKHL